GVSKRVRIPSRELLDCDEWTIVLLSVLVFVVVAGCPVRTAPPTRGKKHDTPRQSRGSDSLEPVGPLECWGQREALCGLEESNPRSPPIIGKSPRDLRAELPLSPSNPSLGPHPPRTRSANLHPSVRSLGRRVDR